MPRAQLDKNRRVLLKRAEIGKLQENVKRARQRIAGAKAELAELRKQK
jgi:hypothetical protein